MVAVDLSGVPETMLWPLWSRAAEARRIGGILNDPLSKDLVDRIDYNFIARFGLPTGHLAIRARVGDDAIAAHIAARSGDATIVALGEGLETQLWRLRKPPARWISVDLPEAIAVRRRLLPAHEAQTLVARSAFDEEWMDAVGETDAPFISAAGLFMYFRERDVRKLLTMIIKRFPKAALFFDTIPPATSLAAWRGLRLTPLYRSPPMPWGVRLRDLPRFVRSIPGWKLVWVKSYGDAFPARTPVSWAFAQNRQLNARLGSGLVHIKGMG